MNHHRFKTAHSVPPDFEYQPVGYDRESAKSKGKLEERLNRDIRGLADLPLFGRRGILCWIIRTVGFTLVSYTFFCGLIVPLALCWGISVPQDILGLPPRFRPFLVDAMLLLAALIVGFGAAEAAERFKTAIASIIRLKASVEKLRAEMLASTNDPKLRFAAQVLICWCIVLLQKQVVFFREDYSASIRDLIPAEFRDCVLFDPEVLWSFDKAYAEVVFDSFISEAKLFDSAGQMSQAYQDFVKNWTDIQELMQVRTPETKHMLGKSCVSLFLVVLPTCCGDLFTVMLAPLAACIFLSILQLCHELSDPWGTDRHDPPLRIVLQFLCMPVWGEEDMDVLSASLTWLNAGLSRNEWTWTADHPIPRTKERGASKGTQVTFEDYQSLSMIAGHKTHTNFLQATCTDMAQAESRGRRMPDYLRWRGKSL